MLCLDQDVMQDVVERAPPHTFVEVETDDQYGWKNARLSRWRAAATAGSIDAPPRKIPRWHSPLPKTNPPLSPARRPGQPNSWHGFRDRSRMPLLAHPLCRECDTGIFTPPRSPCAWQSRAADAGVGEDASTGGGAEVHHLRLRGGALGNHLRLVRRRAAASRRDGTGRARRLRPVLSQVALGQPAPRRGAGDACPQPERCFERLFTRFFAVARGDGAARQRPRSPARPRDLGIHVRSGDLLRRRPGRACAAPRRAPVTCLEAMGCGAAYGDRVRRRRRGEPTSRPRRRDRGRDENRDSRRGCAAARRRCGAPARSRRTSGVWGNAIFKYGAPSRLCGGRPARPTPSATRSSARATRPSRTSRRRSRSRRQARIYDEWGNGPLAAGAPMPQCVLYNFTQPFSKIGGATATCAATSAATRASWRARGRGCSPGRGSCR